MCPLTHIHSCWPSLRSLLPISYLQKTLCATPSEGVLGEASPCLKHCQVELPASVLTHSAAEHSPCGLDKNSKKIPPLCSGLTFISWAPKQYCLSWLFLALFFSERCQSSSLGSLSCLSFMWLLTSHLFFMQQFHPSLERKLSSISTKIYEQEQWWRP